jgi:hypothetical protein
VRGRLVGGFSFAPAGNTIAHSRWNGGTGRNYRSDIFVITLRGGRATRLTTNRHSDDPVWGRQWIVYRRFHLGGNWSIGRLRLLRPNGTGDHPLARGDERTSLARIGLRPLELSRNGTVLLACAAAEFHCGPVMYLVPRGWRLIRRRDPSSCSRGRARQRERPVEEWPAPPLHRRPARQPGRQSCLCSNL